MNHDHEIYGADAHEFNPSRYLDNEGKLKPALINTKEESHGKFFFFSFSFRSLEATNSRIMTLVSYGFGHRICPGR